MKNTFTILSSETDLRGKLVELRCGAVVQIPKDAKMYFARPKMYISYEVPGLRWPKRIVFQNLQREGNTKNQHDIMKVV